MKKCKADRKKPFCGQIEEIRLEERLWIIEMNLSSVIN